MQPETATTDNQPITETPAPKELTPLEKVREKIRTCATHPKTGTLTDEELKLLPKEEQDRILRSRQRRDRRRSNREKRAMQSVADKNAAVKKTRKPKAEKTEKASEEKSND